MPETHDLGRAFVQRIEYIDRKHPVISVGRTSEIEYPYRVARPLVIRIPFTSIAFAIGWWSAKRIDVDEDEALLGALGGRWLSDVEQEEIRQRWAAVDSDEGADADPQTQHGRPDDGGGQRGL